MGKSPEKMFGEGSCSQTHKDKDKGGLRGPIRFPPEPVRQVGTCEMFLTLLKAERAVNAFLHYFIARGFFVVSSGNCSCPAPADRLQTIALLCVVDLDTECCVPFRAGSQDGG